MGMGYNTIVILEDGSLMATGRNDSGQFGIGDTVSVNDFKLLPLKNVKQVASGHSHNAYLTQDGKVYTAGYNVQGQLANKNNTNQNTLQAVSVSSVKQIACGSSHTMLLLQDGSVMGSGLNTSGQLGNGSISTPSGVNSLVNPIISYVKQIACGDSHTMFLLEDGTVKTVGGAGFGQLGLGDKTNKSTPQNTGLQNVKQVAAGNYHNLVLMNDGTVKSFGANTYGQLGIGNTTEQSVAVSVPLTGVKQVACSGDTSYFLMEDGTVKGCGYGYYGNLGNGNAGSSNPVVSPITVPLSDVKSILCNKLHAIFIMNDGSTMGLGYNGYGQLGIGSAIGSAKTPTKLTINNILGGIEYVAIPIIKLLFKKLNQLSAWSNNQWKALTGTLTKELFMSEGVSSLGNIPKSELSNGTQILKWSDKNDPSSIGYVGFKTLYDASNKLYKGIGIVETATESLAFKPKTLIVNGDHTEAIFSFSLDDGATWYTITSGEVKDISGIVGTKLKVRASLPTATSTLTALSYAWA